MSRITYCTKTAECYVMQFEGIEHSALLGQLWIMGLARPHIATPHHRLANEVVWEVQPEALTEVLRSCENGREIIHGLMEG